MAINGYFKLNYHKLLMVIGGNILLMAIGGYFHYYQNGVQFTSFNHYGTLKREINSLHFIDFTSMNVFSL